GHVTGVQTCALPIYPHTNTGLVNSAQMSFSCGLPLTMVYPTGCCIQELAAMMNAPDSTLPSETAQMVSRWVRRGSLSQPNSHSRSEERRVGKEGRTG